MADEKSEEQKGEEGQAESAAQAPKLAGKKKLLIIGGGVFGLLLLIGTPLFFFSSRGGEQKVDAAAVPAPSAAEMDAAVLEGKNDEDQLDENEEALGTMFPMESFVVNLGAKGSYLRCQMQFEFEGLDVPRRFYGMLVPIRENTIRILSSRKPEEVLSWDGKEALKEEIKTMVNDLLRKELVRKVYFTQFVVQ